MGNNCTVSLIETLITDGGDADALECLLRQSPRSADRAVDLYGNTPAMAAARLGCYHLVPSLWRFGCRLEARNYAGQSIIGIIMNRVVATWRMERESRATEDDDDDDDGARKKKAGKGGGGGGRHAWMNRKKTVIDENFSVFADDDDDENARTEKTVSRGSSEDRDCLQFVLHQLLATGHASKLVNDALNRNLDTALMMAIDSRRYDLVPVLLKAGCRVNQVNRDGHTALDILVYHLFPLHPGCDHVQLWHSPASGVVDDWTFDRLPWIMRTLLSAGATGHSLGWFVLHVLSEDRLIGELCRYTADLATNRLVAKLLLQTSVKYCQERNLRVILKKGVDVRLFWEPVSGRSCFQSVQVVTWDRVMTYSKKEKMNALCEHVLDSIKLPINGALLLLQAANSSLIIRRIIDDLIRPIDPYDDFQTGRAIEIFYPYAILCRTFPGTNLLTALEHAGLPVRTATPEMKKLSELYNLDLSEHFRSARRVESLQTICRMCIRMHVTRSTHYAVDRLPLPPSLRQFIS